MASLVGVTLLVRRFWATPTFATCRRCLVRSGHERARDGADRDGSLETETGSIYAWGLDDDGVDEPPTQRLTSRRITALGVAASLIVIAVAGVVAFVVIRQHSQPKAPSAPVVATVAAPPPTVTMTLPPPVTVTAAAPTGTVPSGPTIGDVCNDRMKFATDPVSGQEMICDNYSENISRED